MHVLFINVQNFKSHTFSECFTTIHSILHCVLRHKNPKALPLEILYGQTCPLGCLIPYLGASLLDQVVGVGLLASVLDWIVKVGLLAFTLDWAVGVGLLAWVFCGSTGTSGYLAQAPQTTPGQQGQQLVDTPHHWSQPLASTGVSH